GLAVIASCFRIDILQKGFKNVCFNIKPNDDLRQELEHLGFNGLKRVFILSHSKRNTLARVYKAINKLSQIK
ncbi:hypothetical protein, partial [Helicobacter pylori]